HPRRIDGSHRVYRLIQSLCGVEPGPPEPAQILAHAIFDGAEEVRRSRVLIRPPANVLPKRWIESLPADDPIPEEDEGQAGLGVGRNAEITPNLIRRGHDRV